MSYDIKKLLDYFDDVVSKYNKWDKKINLDVIEEYLQDVGKYKTFSMAHYEFIKDENQERWKYSKWHKFPDLNEDDYNEINKALQKNIEKKTKECLVILDHVINSVAIYSAILRFVDPVNYGILSPPVEKILEVKRGDNEVARYMNYLSNLNEIKKIFGFQRIADVDKALYVYALLGLPDIRNWASQEYLSIRDFHEANPSIIKQIRARNLFSEIWNQDKLHMAELLYETDFLTAGILYGINLEVGIKSLCDLNKINTLEIKNNRFEVKDYRTLVNELSINKIIDPNEKNNLHNAWHIRCNCIHGNGVTKINVKDLKDTTRLVMLKIKK